MKKISLILLLLVFAQWWFSNPTVDAYSNDISFSYIVKYTGNANKSKSLPMLVALHGNGDSPDNFYQTALDKLNAPARVILLEGPLSYAGGSAWPWTKDKLNKIGLAVHEVVGALSQKYSTIGKPILLGFSGGGMMAYYQALKHGDSYSYIFPVSGQLSEPLIDMRSLSLDAPVIAYHGRSDRVISISGGKNAIKLLKNEGADVDFIEFSSGHHGIFTDMKAEITNTIESKIKQINLY